MSCPKEHGFDESIITLLSGQQDIQKTIIDLLKNMTREHKYDNIMRDIGIYNGKYIELTDWLLQVEKVATLTNSQYHELVTAKSTSTLHKMLKRMGNDPS